jgi:ABC-type protease/lipase transport system fused ATPase/permease subunit
VKKGNTVSKQTATPSTHLTKGRPWLLGVFVLSFLVNVLMLTGPLYMLQVYDRVLSSRSLDTLVALTVIMAILFLFMGVFDHLRARALARVGVLWNEASHMWLQDRDTTLDTQRTVLREADTVAKAYGHPSALGLLDIVWTPMFIVVLAFLHPLIAWVTIGGLLVSLGLAWAAHVTNQTREKSLNQAISLGQNTETSITRDANTLESLGGTTAAKKRWIATRLQTEDATLTYGDGSGSWQTTSKTFRMFFQSVLLGVGALLAVQGVLAPGAMIAGSILGGRALAPVDQILSGLSLLLKAKASRTLLLRAFQEPAPKRDASLVPTEPKGNLETTGAAYTLQGKPPVVRELRFSLRPGQCLAVFGASGSGKSSALRLMAGVWKPTAGVVLCDGVPLADWSETQRHHVVGHLGQEALLPEGSIGDILKGFDDGVTDDDAIQAAQLVGVHDAIIALPKGYAERVEAGGNALPYGLRRGILLAQALRGKRSVLVLDTPENGLNLVQIAELCRFLRKHIADGKSLVLATENADLLQLATHALVMEKGQTSVFAPIMDVVKSYVKDYQKHQDRSKIPSGLLPPVMRRVQALVQAPATPKGTTAPEGQNT